MEITVKQLAALVKGAVEGDENAVITGYAKIEEAQKGQLTFLANPKYTHFIYDTEATAVLVRNDFEPEHEVNTTLIRVEDPYVTLADLLNIVGAQMAPKRIGIEQPSFVSEGVTVPDDAYIGAFAYIGKDVHMSTLATT